MTRAFPADLSGPGFLADMEIELTKQALALGAAFVLGLLLGLVYDILRPLRRRASKAAAACIDVFYGLSAGWGVFLYAMAAPGGRLGIWELSLTLLGFLVYTWTLSDMVYRLTDGVYSLIMRLVLSIEKILKKFRNVTK